MRNFMTRCYNYWRELAFTSNFTERTMREIAPKRGTLMLWGVFHVTTPSANPKDGSAGK
jgi:uncharacterized protein YbaP (TraB family)